MAEPANVPLMGYDGNYSVLINRIEPGDREAFIRLLNIEAIVLPHAPAPQVCRDPDDDYLLGCAALGGAHYLVTGDDDLLALRQYGETVIVGARTFLSVLATWSHRRDVRERAGFAGAGRARIPTRVLVARPYASRSGGAEGGPRMSSTDRRRSGNAAGTTSSPRLRRNGVA
jgi:hypothetical protein